MPTVHLVELVAVRALFLLGRLANPALAAPPEPGFWPIGNPGGKTQGTVAALSIDGSIAGGGALGIGYTWTREFGRFDFGLLPGMPQNISASAMSSARVVIAGSMNAIGGIDDWRAYRWNGADPLQDLGVLPGETRMFGKGVSGDGNVVVGYGEHGDFTGLDGQAFRWTASGGLQGLGHLYPFSVNSLANGISRDGSTIVGSNLDGTLTQHAFVWKESTGMTALPGLAGGAFPDTYAQAVSADGSVVVGEASHSVGTNHAVRWVDGQVEDLIPAAYSNLFSRAWAVSDDGSVVGGSFGPDLAFIWTPETKLLLAIDYLALFGVIVPAEYKLEQILAISGDGLTFGGSARNLLTNTREGFVATVPASGGPCPPDCDNSGTLNIDDFICFQTFFSLGDAKADCDASGALTIDDFMCFQTGFAIGC